MSHKTETSCNSSNDENETALQDLEVEAAISFIEKIAVNFTHTTVKFHVCRLTDAINRACMVQLDMRKILCLYLHNAQDTFSSIFCANLKDKEVVETLNRSFFVLGWDIEEPQYQSALIHALNKCNDLSILSDMLSSKISAVLCVVPVKDSITIFSCIKGKVSHKDFLVALTNAEKFLNAENQEEKSLEDLAKKTGNKNDMDSKNYQKLMADMLGDRDYDSFEYDQHEYLKKKIAFAMLGPPQNEEGYEKKDMKTVQSLYESIIKNNSPIAKYKDRVEISFIYNCTEPLPSEKLARAKKYKEEYNPNVDVLPLPIFVLRKCRGSSNPCRIFVDNTGRSYNTWQEYVSRNKLHKCQMILPQNGRYEVDENDEGADFINTAGGLISGGIFVAAAIPTVAVAPAAIVAGGIIGLGVGIYSLGRGAYTLYDRKKHKETLNFINSEARGAYLNIVASSLGFVWSRCDGSCFTGASAAVKTIGFAKMSADSLSILNAGCDLITHWSNETRASLLTLIQLRSCILFFGNVVYTFEMASIDVTDVKTLQDNHESFRNNRRRKALRLLKKKSQRGNQECSGKEKPKGVIEVVSPIREVHNREAVHEILLKSNEILTDNGVKFHEHQDGIRVNDVQIDVAKFSGINRKESSVLLTTETKSGPAQPEIDWMTKTICKTLGKHLMDLHNVETLSTYLIELLNGHSKSVKWKIADILSILLPKISSAVMQTLEEIFPEQLKYLSLVQMIVQFFGEKAELVEERYNSWLVKREEECYEPVFGTIDKEEGNRTVRFFEHSVNCCYEGETVTEEAAGSLLDYFFHWLAEQVYLYQVRTERKTRRKAYGSRAKRVPCSACGGYYYQNA
ncbi:hypothetical protein NQ318_018791 [Aromia moschata]|uniref:DUF4781 domain-containing protein n=1 Tax=Aromia moschata TaxID=1265417 RepID=A0AAV8ZII2_9CUCU|nr:hypothetical protein NQ318_018791 [Aromia moschata]